MKNTYECCDCRARSPDVETEYTLISSRFGWRLTRRIARDGALSLEWRCPGCWGRYKQAQSILTTPSDGMPAYVPPEDATIGPPSSERDGKRRPR